MNKRFVQINGLKSNLESEDENLSKVKFGNESVHHINFMKLTDNNYYSETINAIKNKIYEIEGTMQIKEESIKLFIHFFQNEKIAIPIDQFIDIYILSEFFNTAILTRELDNIGQKEFFNDLNIIFQILQDLITFKLKIETNLYKKIENIISSRINECFKNPKFSHLPVSTIYKILSVTNKENLNTNLLVDFITDSIDSLFVLFDFVEIQKVPTDKLEKIIKLNTNKTEDQTIQKPLLTNNNQTKQTKNNKEEEKTAQKPLSVNNSQTKQTKNKNVEEKTVQKPLPINNIQIKQTNNKNEKFIFQVCMSRNEIEKAKQEINKARLEVEKAKEEMERLKKQKMEEMKQGV